MRTFFKLVISAVIASGPMRTLHAQDLAPRTYVITPIHWNAVTVTYSFSDGAVLLNGSLPVQNGSALLDVPLITFFHSLNFFGRSANFTATLPYGVGHFQGTFRDN